MSKTTKTEKRRFMPWCREAEQDQYNEESRRGWHLSQRTFRSMTYEYDPDVEYRYAIDYRYWHDESRYLELFEEDGWELAGTIGDAFDSAGRFVTLDSSRDNTAGCWYIFRKKYDPLRPEAEYEIATDDESIQALRNTLKRKYQRELVCELFLFFLWGCNLFFSSGRSWFLILLMACVFTHILASSMRLLCVTVFQARRPITRVFHWLRVLFLILLLLTVSVLATDLVRAAQYEKAVSPVAAQVDTLAGSVLNGGPQEYGIG